VASNSANVRLPPVSPVTEILRPLNGPLNVPLCVPGAENERGVGVAKLFHVTRSAASDWNVTVAALTPAPAIMLYEQVAKSGALRPVLSVQYVPLVVIAAPPLLLLSGTKLKLGEETNARRINNLMKFLMARIIFILKSEELLALRS
jgi:hypothetical protein